MGTFHIPTWKQAVQAVKSDQNVRNLRKLASQYGPELPQQSIQYALSKVPIVQWLPRYSPRWLLNDVLAGITIGVLLVPQSLSYAGVANLPASYGLVSSWLPTLLYAFMGTSKGESMGPASFPFFLSFFFSFPLFYF